MKKDADAQSLSPEQIDFFLRLYQGNTRLECKDSCRYSNTLKLDHNFIGVLTSGTEKLVPETHRRARRPPRTAYAILWTSSELSPSSLRKNLLHGQKMTIAVTSSPLPLKSSHCRNGFFLLSWPSCQTFLDKALKLA